MKADYPKLRKRWTPSRKKKKNLMATWEDLDCDTSSSSSDKETTNICLMVRTEEVTSDTNSLSIPSESESDSDSDEEDLSYLICQKYRCCEANLFEAEVELEQVRITCQK